MEPKKDEKVLAYEGTLDDMPDELKAKLFKAISQGSEPSTHTVINKMFREFIVLLLGGFAVMTGILTAAKVFGVY